MRGMPMELEKEPKKKKSSPYTNLFAKEAIFKGTCKACGNKISPGDEIVYDSPQLGWIHKTCPPVYHPIILIGSSERDEIKKYIDVGIHKVINETAVRQSIRIIDILSEVCTEHRDDGMLRFGCLQCRATIDRILMRK